MKSTITTLAVILAVTLAIDARQEPVRQRVTAPEVVLTGCLVQGSSPAVFIFDNAKKDPKSAVEKGERYLLRPTIEDVDLRTHLKHQVRITGEVDMRVSAMPTREVGMSDPARPAEPTLQRLIVKTVTMVSDKCPTGSSGQ